MKYRIVNYKNSEDYNIDRLKVSQPVSTGNKKYIPFGDNNLAPNEFLKYGREIVNHRCILNSKVRYTKGTALISDDEKTNEILKQIKTERYLYDEFAAGNAFIELITDGKKSYLKIFHIEVSKARIASDKDGIIYNSNWVQRKSKEDKKISFYPNWTKGDDGQLHSVIWKKSYEPEFINGIPSWFAGKKSAEISNMVNVTNKSRLDNGYMKDGILLAPIEDPGDQKKLQDKINKKDSGSDNAGGITVSGIPTMSIGDDNIPKPTFIDLRMDLKGMFMDLQKNSIDELIRIHDWFRVLSGMADNTGFDTNRINDEYQVALNTSIKPKQQEYLDIYKRVLEDFGYKTDDIRFVNNSPINNINKKIEDFELLKEEFGVDELDMNNPLHVKLFETAFKC